VQLSGVLKRVAVKLSPRSATTCGCSPRAAHRAERDQPAADAAGLVSIMPGKVNPVIPEVVNQVCFQVIGNDLTVTMAAEAGQLQLNVFEP
jgi:aspartate ammonia-lyase